MTWGEFIVRVLIFSSFNGPIVVVALGVRFLKSLDQILQEKGSLGGKGLTSYSRVSGLFGSVIVTSFFWALGNLLIWKALDDPDQVSKLVDGTFKFFLVGSALFLPYAFNQLREIFAPTLPVVVPPAPTLSKRVIPPSTTTVLDTGPKVTKSDDPNQSD